MADRSYVSTVVEIPEENPSLLGRFTGALSYAFERIVPDSFVFAILLSLVVVVLARFWMPNTTLPSIAIAWYGGVTNLFTFAFQIVLMLVSGYTVATTPLIRRALERIASTATTPRGAVTLVVIVSMLASWTNWGLGLVTGGLLAREVAKRVKMDFGWLVAAAYTGFVVSTEGLSGSIALSQATHGSALNVVEKITGQMTPLSETVFTRFNMVPVLGLFIVMPVLFRFLKPAECRTVYADPEKLRAEDAIPIRTERTRTLATMLDRAWILNVLIAALIGLAVFLKLKSTHGGIDLNIVILILITLGLLLHWRPMNYMNAIRASARVTGPLIIQYPLYGGLMGIITATGLALKLSGILMRFSTAHTLPFYTYLSSLIITLFIPSGGGHWAVQGPFAIPAAKALHASYAATTMAVAQGESVANMLQPFFALPILAIAGIGMRKMLGFMVITFLVALIFFGLSILFLIPAS